jgi:hypothetical protein
MRLKAVPELNIRSFSNLNGIIATEMTVLDLCAILHMRGAIAVPARPARFEMTITVGKASISERILL